MSRALYKTIVTAADKFVPTRLRPLWEHEAGPKTIFFWAPAFKWCSISKKWPDMFESACQMINHLCIQLRGLNKNDDTDMDTQLGLVLAGLGDLNRPVETLSIPQSVSLAATGLIWSRYSLVIIPKNYSLFAVNVFVAMTSLYQIGRAIKYEQDKKNKEQK